MALSKHKVKILDFDQVESTASYLKSTGIEVLVCSNWWIMPDAIIDAPKYKTINIHPSKLPQYRGSVPALWSLKNHDKSTAVSFMVLDAIMDNGAIFAQHPISISEDEDSLSLENKSDSTIRKYLIPDVLNYLQGKLKPVVQDRSKASKTAKYFEYMLIDWKQEKARDIVNKINLYPHLWPPDMCFFIFRDRKISVRRAKFEGGQKSQNTIGSWQVRRLMLRFYCEDGVVSIRLFRDIKLSDSLFILANR